MKWRPRKGMVFNVYLQASRYHEGRVVPMIGNMDHVTREEADETARWSAGVGVQRVAVVRIKEVKK